MFHQTLLDSSPLCAPALARRHHVIALATGIAGFLGALRLLPLLLMSSRGSLLAAQSVLAGAALMLYSLMLCYVHADARRLGLRPWVWTSLVLLISLFGFVLYLTYSAWRALDWRRATLPMAYMLEVVLVGMLVLVPLIYTEALPRTTLSGMILAPSPPPAAPVTRGNTTIRPIRRISQRELLTTPVKVPKIIGVMRDEPEVASEVPGPGVVGVVPGSLPEGTGELPYGVAPIGPPPPTRPIPDTPKPKPSRIRIGGQVEAAKLIRQIKPEYPPLAKMARIQGTVRLEALISTDGTIQKLRVLAGHPFLAQAAIDAVAHWRYQPTLLNGDPVEVVTEIDVNFTLE
jgi:periplasmic protein TonB